MIINGNKKTKAKKAWTATSGIPFPKRASQGPPPPTNHLSDLPAHHIDADVATIVVRAVRVFDVSLREMTRPPDQVLRSPRRPRRRRTTAQMRLRLRLLLLLLLVPDWCRSHSNTDETGSSEVRDLNRGSLRDSGTLLALGLFRGLAVGATASALLRLLGVADRLRRIEIGRRMLDQKMRECICVEVASVSTSSRSQRNRKEGRFHL